MHEPKCLYPMPHMRQIHLIAIPHKDGVKTLWNWNQTHFCNECVDTKNSHFPLDNYDHVMLYTSSHPIWVLTIDIF